MAVVVIMPSSKPSGVLATAQISAARRSAWSSVVGGAPTAIVSVEGLGSIGTAANRSSHERSTAHTAWVGRC